MLIVFALCAALAYGLSDFAGAMAARRVRPLTALAWGVPAGALVLIALLPLYGGPFTTRSVAFALAAGVAGLVGLGTLYRLMAVAPLRVVAPVTGVLAAATPLAFGVVAGERPSGPAWLGLTVGLGAVLMINGGGAAGPGRVGPRILLAGMLSGAGFGGYFVLIAHAGRDSGVSALLVARAGAAILLLLAARRARPGSAARPGRATIMLATAAGLADAAADVFFLLATRSGYVSVAAVITSLYPVVTVLLAVTVLRERAGWRPVTGLGLTAVSLALLAR